MDNTECKINDEIVPSKDGEGIKIKMRMKGKGCKNITKQDLFNSVNK